MAETKEENTLDNTKEPTPLALEGGIIQMELDTKPKPADKNTRINTQTSSVIKNIISTPKETGSSDPSEPTTKTSGSSIPPKEPTRDIITRLEGDGDGNNSDKGPPPNPEENKDTAGMLVDGFNALFLFFIQLWSKDPDTQDYEVETDEKSKLKRYLGAILQRSGKKINPLWIFLGLLLVMYTPMLRKAYNHKKMVDEQREKNKPGATILTGEPRRRRRRSKLNGNNDDAEFYPSEEVK